MKTTATTIAAAIAAFLIGLSFAGKPVPAVDNSATITSLEFAVKNLQAECMTYKSQRDELQAARVDDLTKLDSLTVQLAESQKARQRPEASPAGMPACAKSPLPEYEGAVPSVVPYQRRGLFGRIRNR